MRTKSINKSEILAIHNFLRDAIYHFRVMNCNPDELIVSLPNWLQQLLTSYPMTNYLDHSLAMILEHSRYFDVKIQYHYSDEVVVFFKDYHLNPIFFKPVIHTINFEKEENRKES
ncbi:hypothetical protein [Flavobacterium degerlachei]|jgi:hypothetical protein|uniref:Uncharacterized protein n=1 Tax=Flavobacterium degerlachei TaxID=229203 RepID=A0A1H2Z0J1_9FLAO|nr:hypothetical protein [Flavobacterium degerlachei]SDX10943.1 hypothetical protein SAMN05444338_10750 [Flavobacterium degerlachei]